MFTPFSSVLSWLFLLCLKNTTKASSMKTPKRDGFVNSEKYKVEYIPLNRRSRLSSGFSTVWPIQPKSSWIISNSKKKRKMRNLNRFHVFVFGYSVLTWHDPCCWRVSTKIWKFNGQQNVRGRFNPLSRRILKMLPIHIITSIQ